MKFLISLFISLFMVAPCFAQSMVSDDLIDLFENTGTAYLPTESAPDLGSSGRPMGDIYAGTLNVSGITMSGDLDMDGNNIINVGDLTFNQTDSAIDLTTSTDTTTNELSIKSSPSGASTKSIVKLEADGTNWGSGGAVIETIADDASAILWKAQDLQVDQNIFSFGRGSESVRWRWTGASNNFNIEAVSNDTSTTPRFHFGQSTGQMRASTAIQQLGMQIELDVNQSSGAGAGYTALEVDVTETATDSGTNNLLDLQVGGSSKYEVNNFGSVFTSTSAVRYYGDSTSYFGAYTDAQKSFNLRQNEDISTGNAINLLTRSGAYDLSASSGTQSFLNIEPDINQSGTAGYTGILLDVTETGTGSGSNNLISTKTGGTTKWRVDNSGNMFMHGSKIYMSTTSGSAHILSQGGDGINIRQNSDLASGDFMDIDASADLTASSGTQSFLKINPDINQSGTAGYNGILLDVTETGTGSGATNLIDLQVGSSSKFSVTNGGLMTAASSLVTGSSNFGATNTTGVQINPYASYDSAHFGLGSNYGRQLVFTDRVNTGKDHDHAETTDPTLFLHSVTDPNSDNTQYGSLTHDQTDFVIDTGTGDVKIDDDLNVTGSYKNNGNTGVTDNTSYWLCTAADCSTKCQVDIDGGIIVGCS